jgi:2-oxoisovalerate dehydrogenase E1 component
MTETGKNFNKKHLTDLYRSLLLPRLIEERMLNLLRQNQISKWFSGIGQEAISVGVGFYADRDDYILPMHRNLGVFTSRNVPLYPLFCQLLGKKDGFTKGRDRSFHFGLPESRIVGMISHLAATMPVADGIALANKLKGEQQAVFSFCGDGATSEGDFHEALNLAGVWNLPVIFVIENNGYALSTPAEEQYACEHLVDRADGYGLHGIQIDGNDIFAVKNAVFDARKIALEGKPVMIEALTFRIRGHEEASGTFYVPDAILDSWKEKDPIKRLELYMIKHGYDQSDFDEIRSELNRSLEPDLQKAIKSSNPVFIEENEVQDSGLIRANNQTLVNVSSVETKETRFIDAIQLALKQAFSEDETFILMGQDIAEYGGVFKVTEGFVKQFGKERIRNTPIIESGIIGAAAGLSLAGYKPVVEMQFADFISCGFNQIINMISKGRYRWMPPLNITIRAPHGAGVGAGPFHSQSPEGWFMSHPGLRILIPGTVEDAMDMLYTALYDPNPVLFFEHKKLYRSLKNTVPIKPKTTDLNRAVVRRDGRDLSLITYGAGLQWAEEAALAFMKQELSIEIVDLRTLAPIDWSTIITSVKKTGKALLLQEPSEIMGPMSEISAGITERGFEFLDAPVMRCSSIDTPVPFSRELEKGYLADSRLTAKIEELIRY